MSETLTRLPPRDAVPAPAPAAEVLALGRFSFGVSSAAYQRLQRQTDFRWTAADRFGRRPSQQYLGPGADSITLDGALLPELGDHSSIRILRDLAASGEPQALVDGAGRVYGRWAVTSISETQELLHSDGTPRKRSFSIKMTHYGEDQP